jgi:hypothetical protein
MKHVNDEKVFDEFSEKVSEKGKGFQLTRYIHYICSYRNILRDLFGRSIFSISPKRVVLNTPGFAERCLLPFAL